MNNPLLDLKSLPAFSKIKPYHVFPALEYTLNYCRKTIKKILSQKKNFYWDNLCQPLAEVDNFLFNIWSTINHLISVKNNYEFRKVYKKSLSLISEYNTWFMQNKEIYDAYFCLRNSDNYEKLNFVQKKALNNMIRDFELSGISLSEEKKKLYGKIISRLSQLKFIYSNNVLDATKNWYKLITDKRELSGIPENLLEIAYKNAKMDKKEGWLFTLDLPSYLSIIKYCDNSRLRKEFYYSYNTRASDQGPNANKWDNGPIINEILKLRHELSQLLGFDNYTYMSLSTKMIKDPKYVLKFLNNLVIQIKLQGKEEFNKLCLFAKKNYFCNSIKPWDIAYFSEKQKQNIFSINDEQLRSFFPEKKVIQGLFKIANLIYGINVQERFNIDIWDSKVRFFDIFDSNNQLRGSFYLDMYIRNEKRNGAWMDVCRNRFLQTNGKLQKPIGYLVCNFNCSVNNNQPTLFTHIEVITLFHEFGHILHHILTDIDVYGISGINGIPWDAVELSSQFMENFCWHDTSLSLISSHYKTGKTLPKKLLNNLIIMKNYQSALFILRQLEFGLFDFLIHYEYTSKPKIKFLNILKAIRKKVSITPSLKLNRLPHTFIHIFSGSYAAGYYSYLWSNVLSSDIWMFFKKKGIFNRKIGKDFLNKIISRGGSEEPMELFIKFIGRKPKINSMLINYGIKGK